jgi:hypothetical protein
VATIEACDELDGLKDGIISLPNDCTFDPTTVVGKQYTCPSTNQTTAITETAATVAKLTWRGITTLSGDSFWYGGEPGASFSGLAATICDNGTCVGKPFAVPQTWITDFVLLNRSYDTSQLNTSYFSELFHEAVNRYDSIIGTSDPDLSRFKRAGGKLITWHGLADRAIAPGGTAHYVQQVLDRDPGASEYYRYFEAPGLDHCGAAGGLGWYPGDGLKALVDWVEKGVAPETLEAETTDGRKANLCAWPKHLVYVGGDPDAASSFMCH